MEVTYFTCLNDECYRYRGVFVEGDAEHTNCERAPLSLEREEQRPSWLAMAAPVAVAAGLAAAATVAVRAVRARRDRGSEGDQ
ncbi:MAG TPA: hypothetical protein VFE17_06630 [Candidatus Baltobacteraceae bacterium]|jgi:negative regulator of sigma E activity|nr:hypothetical protein [Candidatus Baltobacteraceae bacterium]